jgi:hypothetical protein
LCRRSRSSRSRRLCKRISLVSGGELFSERTKTTKYFFFYFYSNTTPFFRLPRLVSKYPRPRTSPLCYFFRSDQTEASVCLLSRKRERERRRKKLESMRNVKGQVSYPTLFEKNDRLLADWFDLFRSLSFPHCSVSCSAAQFQSALRFCNQTIIITNYLNAT